MIKFNIHDFRWTREPADFTVSAEKVEIVTKPHTDLWQRTYYHFRNDNAPVLQMETEEKFFSFVVKTSFEESHHRFDQRFHDVQLLIRIGAMLTTGLNGLRHVRQTQTAGIFRIRIDQRQFDDLGIIPEAVPPFPVFRKGMDIGVVPISRHLKMIRAQHLDALIGTGRTANMEKCFHNFLRS